MLLPRAYEKKGWEVSEDPHIQRSEGLRKPNVAATKVDRVCEIYLWIVSGQQSVDVARENKVEKYRNGKSCRTVDFSWCALSWRGVCSMRVFDFLLELGLTERLLSGRTTIVTQGSHMNSVSWSYMSHIFIGRSAARGRGYDI